MVSLIAVTFPDEATAFGLRAALARLQSEHLIDMEDISIVTRSEAGKVKLHQAFSLHPVPPQVHPLWSRLVGRIFLDPDQDASEGTSTGALANMPETPGIGGGFMLPVREDLRGGGSVLFVLVRSSPADKLLARLEPFRGAGRILQASLSTENMRDLVRP